MITCPKHKIPLKLRRDIKMRDQALACPFCKVEKRAGECHPANPTNVHPDK